MCYLMEPGAEPPKRVRSGSVLAVRANGSASWAPDR